MANKRIPFPRPPIKWIDPNGTPTMDFLLYMAFVDGFIAALAGAGGTPLISAANDTAAATAGVAINGFYRNGNVVQIRLV
jgi:hypothetical protein